jgi:outer membrane lipoprotein carrier protein
LEVCRRMDFVKFWLRHLPAIDIRGAGFLSVRKIVGAGILGLGSVALAWSQTGSEFESATVDVLERFVEEIDDLSATFEQRIFDVDDELVEESSGTFQLLRPDRFAWYYDQPYELEVVADGESLWMYDVELEQVTRAPLSDLAASPAQLLSGESSIRERFAISDIDSSDDRRWLELKPLDENSEFSSARVAFNDGVPTAIQLVDGLAQTTLIEFADIAVNSGLRRRDFDFDPPRGVDVIGADR